MKHLELIATAAMFLTGVLSTVPVLADPLLAEAKRLAEAKTAHGASLSLGMSDEAIKSALVNFNKLKWTHILPVTDLIMIENENGEHLLMDSNARIAIRGKVEVFDMWNKRPIKTKADAQASWLVSLDRFNIQPEDLASYHYGLKKDKPDLTILVDPKGDHNKKLFDQLVLLGDKYSFEIVLTPLLGDASVMESLKFWCSTDVELSLKQLMAQEGSTGKILPTCDRDPIIKSLALAGILHINALPFLIRADGLHTKGVPDSILEFLKREITNLGEIKSK